MALGNYQTNMAAPKIDLYAARRVLAGRVMQNTTQQLIFRNGYGLTEDFSNDTMAAEIRILRHRRPTIESRTMRTAADDNSAHWNTLDPAQPRTKEYGLKLVEVYDRVVALPDVLEHMIGIGALNLEAQGIEQQLARIINAYTFAVQIAVKLNEDGEAIEGEGAEWAAASTLVLYNPSSDELTQKLIEANAILDEGAEDHDIDTFTREGRVAVFTPQGKLSLVSTEKSVFNLGSSRGVQLLEIGAAGGLETKVESDLTGFFGELDNTPLHMVSKPIWKLVGKYLGLSAGAIATFVDNVVGMVVASEATGRGIAYQNSLKVVDAPQGQGYLLQPLTRFGVETWISEGIQLIMKNTFRNPTVTWNTLGTAPVAESFEAIEEITLNPVT